MSNTHIHKNKAKIKRVYKDEGRRPTRKEAIAACPQMYRTNGKGSPLATCNCWACKEGRKCGWNQKVIRSGLRTVRELRAGFRLGILTDGCY